MKEAQCPFCKKKIIGGYTKLWCLCQDKDKRKTKKDKFGLEWYV